MTTSEIIKDTNYNIDLLQQCEDRLEIKHQ
jgi:hypothetical protein